MHFQLMSRPSTFLTESDQHAFAMLFASLRRKGFLWLFRNMRQAKKFGLITSYGHPGQSTLRSKATDTMLGRGDDSITSAMTAASHRPLHLMAVTWERPKTVKVAEARERSARPEIGCVPPDLHIR